MSALLLTSLSMTSIEKSTSKIKTLEKNAVTVQIKAQTVAANRAHEYHENESSSLTAIGTVFIQTTFH